MRAPSAGAGDLDCHVLSAAAGDDARAPPGEPEPIAAVWPECGQRKLRVHGAFFPQPCSQPYVTVSRDREREKREDIRVFQTSTRSRLLTVCNRADTPLNPPHGWERSPHGRTAK